MISITAFKSWVIRATVLAYKSIVAFAIEVFSNHPVLHRVRFILEDRLTRKGLQHSPQMRLLSVPTSSQIENPSEILGSPLSIAITRLATDLVSYVFTMLCCHRCPPLEDGPPNYL